MRCPPRPAMIVASFILASASSPGEAYAQTPRSTAIERYGLGGHIQAIGIHHGFHVETVTVDSPAADDRIKAHDVIMKVDGESIRSLDHLRTLFAEAYIDDGEVTITYTRGGSLEHRVVQGHLKVEVVRSVGKKRRAAPVDDDRR